MRCKQRLILLIGAAAFALSAVEVRAQGQPIPQPQLSPYLYLLQGGPQGYLNYRQATAPQTPIPDSQYGRAAPRELVNTQPYGPYQPSPATTGINQNLHGTGHADVRGKEFMFQNYSHYFGNRLSATRLQQQGGYSARGSGIHATGKQPGLGGL